MASPVVLTEEFVGGKVGDTRFPLKWPKTLMTMGSHDPLSDAAILMMEKMVPSGIDCELILYEGIGHCLVGLGCVLEKGERPDMEAVKHLKKLMRA